MVSWLDFRASLSVFEPILVIGLIRDSGEWHKVKDLFVVNGGWDDLVPVEIWSMSNLLVDCWVVTDGLLVTLVLLVSEFWRVISQWYCQKSVSKNSG